MYIYIFLIFTRINLSSILTRDHLQVPDPTSLAVFECCAADEGSPAVMVRKIVERLKILNSSSFNKIYERTQSCRYSAFFLHFLSKRFDKLRIDSNSRQYIIYLNAQSTKKPSIHPWGSGEHSLEFDPSPWKCQHHGSFFILQLRNLRPALFGEDAIVQFFLFEGGGGRYMSGNSRTFQKFNAGIG